MKPSEEQWNRWIDGDLSPEEAAAMEAAALRDADLGGDPAFFSQLSQDLKQTYPAERSPPFPDFFNSHLQKQIRDLREAPVAKERPSWWPDWFRLSWAMPLAAAAAVVLALTQIGLFGGRTSGDSQIVSAYTPDDSVRALIKFDDEAHAMVVRLEGIDKLPVGFDLLLADADDAPIGEAGPFVVEAAPQEEAEPFEFVGPRVQFATHRPAY
jgi:anti-sigma-K factor RskA